MTAANTPEQALKAALDDIQAGNPLHLFTFSGDELLSRRATDKVVDLILKKRSSGINYVVLESPSASQVAEEIMTIPMFRGPKVVVVREPEFLLPKKGRTIDLSKIKSQWDSGKKRAAASRLLGILAKGGLGVNCLLSPDVDALEELGIYLEAADFDFLRDVGLFCEEEEITSGEGGTAALEDALNRGFPKKHVLIVEVTKPDGKNAFLKRLKKEGVFVEQTVEQTLRKLDIHDLCTQLTEPFGKTLDSETEAILKDLCGGNTRLIQSEVEKLCVYVGDERQRVLPEDVRLLVHRVREEEYTELSDAIGKRMFRDALRYVEASLRRGEEALKIHGAVASQIRQLLTARARWLRFNVSPRTSQREFEAKCLPLLKEECDARGAKMPHPYVAWLNFQACMRYELSDLVRAMSAVADADVELKSGGQPRQTLMRMMVRIFRRGG